MSVLRKAAITLANTIPPRWKRALKWQLMIPDAGASLDLLRRKGFSPHHVLDIGGFVGNWTRTCKEIWPDANVCIFEPQPERKPGLEKLRQQVPGVTLRTELLSDRAGESVPFHVQLSGSSMLNMRRDPNIPAIMLQTQTLSAALAGTPFATPDLIKIDVQGAELKVFNGGQDVLAAAQVVMMEVSVVDEYIGCPLIGEVIAYMGERGFLVHDICTVWRNTPSQSMNQADIIFVKAGSPLTEYRHYRC